MIIKIFEKIKSKVMEDLKNVENNKSKNFNLKEFISSNKTLVSLVLFMFALATIILNVILSSIDSAFNTINAFTSGREAETFNILTSIFNLKYMFKYPLIYLIGYIILTIPTAKLIFNLKKSFETLNLGQKGKSRFTTLEEIQAQYKAIPEKDELYKGGGGVPISRYKDKIYIDTSPVNNLIIGTTRSGKGEMIVVPINDIYSRAEFQASLIVNDPKGELIAMSKETLENRGYRVECLNLLNPLKSLSYNPLQLIIDAYHNGDIDEAQSLCKTLTYSLYYNPSAKDPFWQNSAMSLVNGLILAIIDECDKKCKIVNNEILQYEKKNNELLRENKEQNIEIIKKNERMIELLEKEKEKENSKITLYTVANMLSELGGKDIQVAEVGKDGKEKFKTVNALDNFFQNLPVNSVAKMQYATSKFADGSARGSIFAVAMDELSRFTMNSVAKMTSKNSIDLKDVGFNKRVMKKVRVFVKEKLEGNKDIIISPIENTETRNYFTGIGDIEIKKGFEFNDEIFLKDIKAFGYKGEEIKAKIEVDSVDIDIDEVGEYELIYSVTDDTYENKPVALFLVTPDYDGSNHVLSSIFIRQLYYVLAKEASLSETGKCEREVIFNLDEFGNMPAIEGFANIITVCLGRRIRFNLVIQSLAQLKKLYGEDDKTIIGNCGNLMYILTNDTDTAEVVSKSLGEETITIYSRSGEELDITKNRTESLDNSRLLLPSDLLEFKEGEMVVKRVIKRQDLKGNRIVPYPIYNHDETAMKFRWEYLSESFDNEKAFKKIKIKSKHRNLNLNDLLINFDESEEEYRNRLNSLYEEKTIEDKENINKTLKRDIKIGDILTREEMSSFSMIFLRYRKELDKFNLDRIDENTPFEKIEEAYSKSNIPVLQERLKFLKNKLEEKENEVMI
ncbi:type IV secretory system conjugative DNA transfer family protein [Clostridium perfringens]|uniref:Type IV secretory system conjugative DNA transfer family protein n=3 Tax=Clostridium perfringens TaxID=1502 RepID=A0ABD4PTY6_CLOPF|nr:type IV secretory system conjugative DNA transfer family protein [Clostridium perfringens]MBO3304209.1 type IV secretory system conjugative DNA transfer family protein [Clostridium perfringens]MBO3307529.1 type IV secretory system conjugative DNA transfer family protein [Clostridium perfringens]MBO3317163.1 type IV secretory system conjugative DNA transfer family protein [Clostridium perfringens]MBO3323850.1 type IV secretory system conjugative DNA transfer family protein [Clostridium perfri